MLAGGPSASNPEPLAPFVDVFFMGEAEEGLLAILDVLGRCATRRERLDELAKLPYLYVPARGRHPVERAVYASFDISTQPLQPVVPYASAIFSRASVEVMRGCTRGCRFCHAGTWYRPVRERSVDDIVKAGLEQLGCTGYDELSLTSLATSDYTGVEQAIGEIKRARPSLHLSLPSNRVDTGPVAMNAAANARQGSITLAPEAATQRMRDIICKTITDEMIEQAIEAAFKAGYTSLKLYFMIGLPRETFAEVQGIVDLGLPGTGDRAARDPERAVHRPRLGLELRAEAAHAVPVGGHVVARPAARQAGVTCAGPSTAGSCGSRSTTPAPRCSRARSAAATRSPATSSRRRGAPVRGSTPGRSTTRRRSGTRRSRRTGATIVDEATREREALDPLPWDHVRSGVTKEFLLDEWWASRAERATGDCRWDGCTDCGACMGPVRNRLVS